MMNTVLGLLAKGDMNCAGNEISENGDLFGPKSPSTTTADIHNKPRTANEIKSGVVITEAEKQKAEEEADARKRREEERKAEEEAEQGQGRAERKENAGMKKPLKQVQGTSSTTFSPKKNDTAEREEENIQLS